MNANTGMDEATFELARSHALPVCDNAASSFNRRMANFIKALLAPLQDENEKLHAEVETLRAALARTQTPSCPPGMTEYHAKIDGVELVFHFEYLPAEKPHHALDYRTHATMNPVAWFHKGDNITDVFDIDAKNNSRICNEALAAYKDSK